jgi:hypothetical protein
LEVKFQLKKTWTKSSWTSQKRTVQAGCFLKNHPMNYQKSFVGDTVPGGFVNDWKTSLKTKNKPRQAKMLPTYQP